MWQNPEIFCRVENLAQKWEFWPLRTSKGWNLTKSRKILICVANLTQKWDWPLWTCGGWNLAKSRNFQSRWKFGLKSRVWPFLTCKGWNFAKSRNFDMCQKFSSKLTFVTQHKQMRDMLARAMCTKVKICQILDNDLSHIFFMIHIFSGMETWPEKLVYMLCCLFVSLTCLLNEMFTCLKYGFFNSWNFNKSI